MRQRQTAMIPAIVLCVIHVVGIASARADDPHTVGHAAEHFPTGTTRLDLRSNGIQSIDGIKHFTSAETVLLSENEINFIPNDAFSGLSSLERLYLNYNQIASIPSNAFSGLPNLDYLTIHGNQLTSIPSDIFSGLSALQTLNLHQNQITDITSDAFIGPSGLYRLSLGQNQITSIASDSFSGLSSLESLGLDNNQITSIPSDSFSGLSSLEFLYLDNNQLTSIPSDAFSGLANLRYLYLGNNQLTSIPNDAFSGLSSLETLSLYSNGITSIPSNAFVKLSSLQAIVLYRNQISDIHSNVFSGLSGLHTITLAFNQLTSIPSDSFSGLANLRTLSLGDNQLTELNLSGSTLLDLRQFSAHAGNTISAVDLSRAIISQMSFGVVVRDMENGGVLSLDLRQADLSMVTSYTDMKDWDDLETLDLSFATLGSNRVDYLTDNLAGLNDLAVSFGQWNTFSQRTQDELILWDAVADNLLSFAEDVDGDRMAGLSDLAFIQAAQGVAGDDATDLNNDGVTGRADIVTLLSEYGSEYQSGLQASPSASPSSEAVPEPTTMSLLLIGTVGIATGYRRRRRIA